jgi:hypothetical protein
MFGPCPGRQQPAALTPESPLVHLARKATSATADKRILMAGRWQGLALVQLSDFEPGFVCTACL